MDTTVEYMKMIEKSSISKLYNVGDYIFQKSPNDSILWDVYTEIVHDSKDEYELALIADPSWFEYDLSTFSVLLRQDQLQDMVHIDRTNLNKNYPDFVYMFDYFFIWWDRDYEYTQTFKSAEQTWLAYVMHELYGKRWDGSDWVVE